MAAEALTEFIAAACVPRDSGHATGTLDRAEAILAEHPQIAKSNIHTAAILGDDAGVRRFLETDKRNATSKGGPFEWDALTHLCFSRYLRLDPARSDAFVRSARMLLDAGASSNTGWFEMDHQPKPEWEPALYGAAGIAHHPELTKLLLERGAEPNDEEVVYHTPESYDNRALQLLVETGKITDDNLVLMLIRKIDWHDVEGIKWLLDHGAKTNVRWRHGLTPIHHAIARDNDIENIELLLEHGADPTLASRGKSAIAFAARRGRNDLLEMFERRGFSVELDGVERLITACARNDSARIRSVVEREPKLVQELIAEGGQLLAEFAGVGNTDGVRQLLERGVDVGALFKEGDGYRDVAKNSTALHVAAWRARHETVRLLIRRGAPVNARDGKGRMPLMLAVKACVDSYWTERRSPESVKALLDAGASASDVPLPSGYQEVDELLRAGR